MINPLREGAINRSSEFKFDFSSQLWLMNPPQTDFRFLSARNLPRPRYHPTPLPPWWKIFRPWKGRRSTGVQWHVRVLGEFGGRPTTSENDIHHLSPPFPSSSSSLSCSSSFFLSLSLSFSYIPLVPRIFGTLNPFPLPTIPPHANQPLGFKSGSSLLLINLRISEFIGAIGIGMN